MVLKTAVVVSRLKFCSLGLGLGLEPLVSAGFEIY